MNSHTATIKHHMHYPIFMACTDAVVISLMSLYSLSLGKLPGCFSYEQPAIFSGRTVAISKKLNAAPYLHGVHDYGERPCQPSHALVNS